MKRKIIGLLIGMLIGTAVVGCNSQENAVVSTKENIVLGETQAVDATGATKVTLTDGNIKVDGEGVSIKENKVTIAKAGTYIISGSLSDGQIVVDTNKESKVTIILDNANITCKTNAAIIVTKAQEVVMALKENSKNIVTDGADYSDDAIQSEINGAIFSKADFVIEGVGTLEVIGNYKHGIISKDNLTFLAGDINVTAKDDGIHAKDNIVFEGGNIEITAGDDGIHADGEVTVNDGTIVVSDSYEGVEGTVITCNGGSIEVVSEDDGINATGTDCKIVINGGVIHVDAKGDGVDSNGSMEVNGGELYVSGSTTSNNAALDFEERYGAWVNGGTIIATGSSGMVVAMNSDSKQCSMTVHMGTTIKGGINVQIKDSKGEILAEYTPQKDWQCVVASSEKMQIGETYTIVAGDSSMEVTLENQSTSVGQSGFGGFGRQNGQGGFGGKKNQGDWQMPDGETMPDGIQMPGDAKWPGNGEMPDGMKPGKENVGNQKFY